MNQALKKKILETLYYHLGMIKVLKKHSKQSNPVLYQEHNAEYKKTKELIEELSKVETLD